MENGNPFVMDSVALRVVKDSLQLRGIYIACINVMNRNLDSKSRVNVIVLSRVLFNDDEELLNRSSNIKYARPIARMIE